MPALASDLRKTLEATVVKARGKAEGGARDALTALAVDASEPFGSMSEEERKLRNRLRARGRQLGDQRDAQKGTQSIERLVREMAYEHWHRMLFARFLAENQLLIEPSSGVSISLDECEELATEEGTDLWGLAAQFAQEMLPQIFRTDDPVLAASLPLEIRQQLQGLVAGLETETFTANDSLGWTYQFWQTKRKKEVNDSGVKIGADELSPVTQLFTEDYMVDFLLDNTLGAWHAGKVLVANPELAATAQTEDDMRQAVALPGCPWSYLRFIQADNGTWSPASGTFEGWPKRADELKCLDPCMGSGHFVVAMFERLVALRIAEEDLSEKVAVTAVIQRNLFGLEIDPRCTQIGAFNLALAAWRRVGHCKLPAMSLACSGVAPNTSEAEWLALAGDNERLRNGMGRLYRLFEKSALLGSLINPHSGGADLLVAGFQELQPLLEQALVQEAKDDAAHEMAVTACGLAKAAEILAKQFTLVATNVPYLGRGKQNEVLFEYSERVHPESKADLATTFVERCLQFCEHSGSISVVTPQNWLFLATYKPMRERLLRTWKWNAICRLGPGAFETIGGEVVSVALLTISKAQEAMATESLCLDATECNSPLHKASRIRSLTPEIIAQSDQLANPDSIVTITKVDTENLLNQYAAVFVGSQPGQTTRATRFFWELTGEPSSDWSFMESSPNANAIYSGKSELCLTVEELQRQEINECVIRGRSAWERYGVIVAKMSNLPAALYCGRFFDDNTFAIIPNKRGDLPALWAYVSSPSFASNCRKLNQKLNVTVSVMSQVPFDLEYWQKVAAEKYHHGLPKPFSSDPAQWLFNGHPVDADHPLHVAMARLVGYLWPRQSGYSFTDCPALERDGLESMADEDGIVCLSPARGEAAAADRLRGLLATAFGDEWSNSKERELLLETAVANDGRKAVADLADWLRQSFFAEHCKLFQSRPFIWQVWDGNPQGFSALVNYHKLAAPNGQGRKTLELLTFTYLGDWIDRQKLDQSDGVNGADDRLAAALDLQAQLKRILDGEPPYDIFVRWKPLHQQAIGWEPDINDGLRLNIRPFLSAQLRKGGKAGAGILRAKPGAIKWSKDRGKEPMRSKEVFPWFWDWDENSPAMATDFGAPVPGAPPAGVSFDGNRWNDLHYTRAAKEAARAMNLGEG
ncbi:Eco57I restriction-modification methylase domain-containing protein [Cyanobium sp. A2C-AMD]|uniref:Eco57I restriction-modification methylase domain-containing protein n=1 Tax=Cyanobium sp. A2C-AMD TaxID=2823695 RepID=UPI0020CC2CC8|nr:N-6 DNA methylase [Cyanobium sp. A2C-AMD]MCP9877396.1 N-6 DNA methylase [Cyanobium sp. A2C-AMD]